MITFRHETEIRKPVNDVYALYTDRNRFQDWQPGFVEEEVSASKNGQKQYRLRYRIGNRTMWMNESVIRNSFPHYDSDYSLKGVFNPVRNTFQATPEGFTKWTVESKFRFKGLMKLIAPFMRSGFEKQNRIIMSNFKRYAENKL